jgi:hypothetical protein
MAAHQPGSHVCKELFYRKDRCFQSGVSDKSPVLFFTRERLPSPMDAENSPVSYRPGRRRCMTAIRRMPNVGSWDEPTFN